MQEGRRFWKASGLFTKEIILKAREAGVYQSKTIDMDVLSGLTNFITRQ